MLSVCCLTGGWAPGRLGAILALLRPVADEIVVAVDDRRTGAATELAAHADRLVTFPHADPGDRPIAWLFGLCRGDWILNIDDDEVPSPDLLAELPKLVAGRDVTHCWIARRWLYPGPDSCLDEAPWATDYQLRLVQTDPRFLQFSDEFHRPVVCHGPMRFVDAPLWHLDTAVNSFEARRTKALCYEQARRGMRAAGVSHNSGYYLPELRPGVATAAVPAADAALIEAVLEGRLQDSRRSVPIEHATREEIDAAWPDPPYPEALARASLEVVAPRTTMVAGVQQTIDVRVRNEGDRGWRWGEEATPALRLSYRWLGRAEEGLRTVLPADLAPGASMLVPVHVLPPVESGVHVLEVDLVHEHVRWLGVGVTVEIQVRPRRRIALAGDGAAVERILDALLLVPELEPVLLEPDRTLTQERFGHPRIPGLRSFLFGPQPAARVDPRLLSRTGRLLAAAAGRGSAGKEASAFLDGIREAEVLVVAGADWPHHAPNTREVWRLASSLAAARALGVRIVFVGSPLPAEGLVDRGLVGSLGLLGRSVPEEDLLRELGIAPPNADRAGGSSGHGRLRSLA